MPATAGRLDPVRACTQGDNVKVVTLEHAKQEYSGQWLAFLVTRETPEGQLLGRVIAHNADRRELHRQLRRRKVKKAYITFAGPPVKPGYAVML